MRPPARRSRARVVTAVRERAAAWKGDGGATWLLDVNVLVALVDPRHTHHLIAHRWLRDQGGGSWATCPLTENGVLRIVGHARYRNTPGSPAACVASIESLRAHPGHVFWPDDISLLDTERVDPARLLDSAQITDSYLLALAVAHGGKLATFDKHLVADAVKGGKAALHLIE